MQHPELQVLTIRFVGEQLKKQGLPIYELGLAFVAVQRIVNKAFLALKKRLDKGSFPNRREREILALQIACYEKRSDFFALTPLIFDPVNQQLVKKCIEFVLSGIISYAIGEVLDCIRGKSSGSGLGYCDLVSSIKKLALPNAECGVQKQCAKFLSTIFKNPKNIGLERLELC